MDIEAKKPQSEKAEQITPDQIEAKQLDKLSRQLQANEGADLEKVGNKSERAKKFKKAVAAMTAGAILLLAGMAGEVHAGGAKVGDLGSMDKMNKIENVQKTGNSVQFTDTLSHKRRTMSWDQFSSEYGDSRGDVHVSVDGHDGKINKHTQNLEYTDMGNKARIKSTDNNITDLNMKKSAPDKDSAAPSVRSMNNGPQVNIDK